MMLPTQFRQIEGVEVIEKYVPGGLHPVHLGDEIFHGRYTILHKLGHGDTSTVWLAQDRRDSGYVAVKILMAGARESAKNEKVMHLRMTRATQTISNPNRYYIQGLWNAVTVQSPNGLHHCFVTEPSACSVAESKKISAPVDLFPLDTARAVAAQIILGLQFIHSQGVVHGGSHGVVLSRSA